MVWAPGMGDCWVRIVHFLHWLLMLLWHQNVWWEDSMKEEIVDDLIAPYLCQAHEQKACYCTEESLFA
jgi:hypothetical protein